jgi:hypothetical protein
MGVAKVGRNKRTYYECLEGTAGWLPTGDPGVLILARSKGGLTPPQTYPTNFPYSRSVDLDRMRQWAEAAAGHPTWSVAYAEDVPLLVAEVERLRASSAVSNGMMQDDLKALLRALGMGDHARPKSTHEVMLEAIEEVGRLRGVEHRLRKAESDLALLQAELRRRG